MKTVLIINTTSTVDIQMNVIVLGLVTEKSSNRSFFLMIYQYEYDYITNGRKF